MSSSLYSELRNIKNHKLSVYNRLKSIRQDADFIAELAVAFPRYPLIANIRCGGWYVRHCDHSVYFKSTDGHTGTWELSIRRLNLHLLDLIAKNEGCIIVDSSRRKRMPDSFSRTIPIWAACINRALKRQKAGDETGVWDEALYTPNNVVSRSEHSQMEAKLAHLVDKLQASGADLKRFAALLRKPLRPLWYGPEFRPFLGDPPDFQDADFYPVLLVNASEVCPDDGIEARPGFMYIQGAADDEDSWSFGLTSELYWAHERELQDCANDMELEEAIARLLTNERASLDTSKSTARSGTQQSQGWPMGDLGVTVCSSAQAKEFGDPFPFGALVVLDTELVHPPGLPDSCVLWVKTEAQKKDAHIFERSLPDILGFIGKYRAAGKDVLVCCKTGTDISVAVALALQVDRVRDNGIDKQTITKCLLDISMQHHTANISQASLKVVRKYFLTPPSYHKHR